MWRIGRPKLCRDKGMAHGACGKGQGTVRQGGVLAIVKLPGIQRLAETRRQAEAWRLLDTPGFSITRTF